MKIPLILYAYDKTIKVIKNSELYEYSLPFNPYIIYPNDKSSLKYKLIPTGQDINVGIREYKSIRECDEAHFELCKKKIDHHHLRYNEQLFIDQEDYVLEHPNTEELKILYYDIEVASFGDGLFPRAKDNSILAIGCKFNNEKIKLFGNYNDSDEDYYIISDFLEYIEKKDPDIIVTFNGKAFDTPYLVERCKIKDLDYNKLARFKSSIFNKKNEIVLKNRIDFDIYEHVIKDQTLFGIKSFKMKTVANWRKIPNVIDLEDDEIKNTYKLWKENPERLLKYLESDVRITCELSKGYLNNSIALAEFIKIPLDNVINGYNSFIPKVVCGRELSKLGYVSLDRNHERYNEKSGKYYQTGFKHEGAIVASYKTGYFDKVWKVDFRSMYSSCIATWNLGVDTTKICGMKDFTGEYVSNRIKTNHGDMLYLEIPDTNFNKQIIISIDYSKDGFLKKYIKELFKLRKEYKNKEEEAKQNNDTVKKEQYHSQQWAIKVLLNVFYGYFSLEFSDYGDMSSGLTVTGCCRWLNKYVQELLGDKIINVDTDGFTIESKEDVSILNKKINEEIKRKFGIDDSLMELELEEFEQGYFYRMKNYVIREDGKNILHGVSFKSSRHPGMYDKALTKLANYILDNKGQLNNDILDEIKNTSNYKMEDFVQRIKINKEPKSYDNPNAIQGILIDQIKYILKKDAQLGDQIEYYATINPAPVPTVLKKLQIKKTKGTNYTIMQLVKDRNQLDMEYYNAEVEKVIKLFSGEEIEEESEENDN